MMRMASDTTRVNERLAPHSTLLNDPASLTRQRAPRHDSVGFQGSSSSLHRGGTIQFQRENRLGSQEHQGNYEALHHSATLDQQQH